ncbi:hypothetical protein [Aeromonas simiae]|uniref:hypothetical protein n=2 Tax=Aeromonas simiae TaxID=218936 RepID=UPI00266C1D7B|nr:hypothetical protein [Aeromonas simiae]MDO2950396.1 hypothetical protein [Aeromonas simiae]MDO2953998.1 hypothetical protein [Aeromonas simiae]MDO2957816.1 hypothetical protein [Aeromonas simiae]
MANIQAIAMTPLMRLQGENGAKGVIASHVQQVITVPLTNPGFCGTFCYYGCLANGSGKLSVGKSVDKVCVCLVFVRTHRKQHFFSILRLPEFAGSL